MLFLSKGGEKIYSVNYTLFYLFFSGFFNMFLTDYPFSICSIISWIEAFKSLFSLTNPDIFL